MRSASGESPSTSFEQLLDLGRLRRVGEPPRAARRQRGVGHGCRPEGEPQAGAHGRQPARDRCVGQSRFASAAELRDPVGEDARVDVVQSEVAALQPRGERAQVGAVGALCRLGEPAVLEKAVDRRARVHETGFGAPSSEPSAGSGRRRRTR